MNEQVNQLVMNADLASMPVAGLGPAAEQLQRKQRLAAAFRIFGKFGFDEGVAGIRGRAGRRVLHHGDARAAQGPHQQRSGPKKTAMGARHTRCNGAAEP